MLDSFLTFINRHGLDLSSQKTLLTVSGGVDSIVMANLFHNAGWNAGIAHCNFGLRGEESMLDEMFVRELGNQYNFPVFVKRFDTKDYAKQHAVSTQMAARDLRYAWFDEIRKENGFDWIATAHHAGDSLETSLLNLSRGTGIAGLHGIQFQNGFLIRPLIFALKKELISYAQSNLLAWRDDRSNDSLDYKRNIVRHKVIPVLRKLNPSLESTFQITSERIRAADSLLTQYLQTWENKAVRQDGEQLIISIDAVLSQTESVYRLWSVLSRYGFRYIQIASIVKSLSTVSGKIFYSDSHSLLKDRDDLILKPLGKDGLLEDSVPIYAAIGEFAFADQYLSLEKESMSPNYVVRKESQIANIDEARVTFPLQVRKWHQGDVFCPFGMKGKRKKVSDVLVNMKLNIYQKQQIYVLENADGEIIWLIGIRMDDRYKITDETENIIKITWRQ